MIKKLLIILFLTIPFVVSADRGTILTTPVVGGSSKVFIIKPNLGYRIEDVLIDGMSIGVVTNYTFNNIQSNHTISASFVPIIILSIQTNSLKIRIIQLSQQLLSILQKQIFF